MSVANSAKTILRRFLTPRNVGREQRPMATTIMAMSLFVVGLDLLTTPSVILYVGAAPFEPAAALLGMALMIAAYVLASRGHVTTGFVALVLGSMPATFIGVYTAPEVPGSEARLGFAVFMLLALGVHPHRRPFLVPLVLGLPLTGFILWLSTTHPTMSSAARAYLMIQLGVALALALAIAKVRQWLRQRNKLTELAMIKSERMSSLGFAAAGIGHEINNPLAYIHSNLELLLEDLSDNPEAQEAIREALHGSQRIRDVIRNLRFFAKPETKPRVVAASHIVESATAMLQPEARQKGGITVHFDDELFVQDVGGRTGQVLLNLVTNAWQAVKQQTHAQVVVRAEPRGTDRVAITVEDNGPGIPTSVRDRVFEPFFSTKRDGSGLGLAISRQLVDDMGGELHLRDGTLGGAAFEMIVPRAKAPRKSTTSLPSPGPTQHRRVLIIDDDVFVARSFARVLRSETTEVVIAHDGPTALSHLLAGNAFDLVVCDVIMPEQSGLELYEMARGKGVDVNNFAFVTGGALLDGGEDAIRATGQPLIHKPVSGVDLRSLLESSRPTETEPDASRSEQREHAYRPATA